MHCSTFHHRLDALLDDREDPATDPLLAAHAAVCQSCRRDLNEQATLFAGLSQIKAPSLDSEFAQRIVEFAKPRLRPAPVPSALRRISWALGVALSSAAAMLLAISLVWYAHRREPALAGASAPPAPGQTLRSGFPRIAVLAPPYFGQKQTPRAAPKVTIADVLLESPRLPARLHGYRGALDDFAIGERLEEWEQFSPAIRPLRATLAVIWDTLWRAIPTTRGDSSPPRDDTGLLGVKPLCVA